MPTDDQGGEETRASPVSATSRTSSLHASAHHGALSSPQVTRVPFFRDELRRVLQNKIVDEYLWPRRLVVPAEQPGAIGVPVLAPEQVSVVCHLIAS
jgi:hypothetical protein